MTPHCLTQPGFVKTFAKMADAAVARLLGVGVLVVVLSVVVI